MKTLLAISPHLDDAIFSAGALLARHAARNWRVVIATCFTASMPDPKGFALACQLDKGLAADVDYMALRRAEDDAACALLGCEPLHLDFPEAPHRGYGTAPALFGPLVAEDEVATPLLRSLSEICARLSPDLLAGPAALGAHVDHVIVRSILPRLRVANTMLWADMPYAARTQIDRSRFRPIACGAFLEAKLAACTLYTTQLGFQFGAIDAIENAVCVDKAEWIASGAIE